MVKSMIRHGFTLLELCAVVAIVGILASVAMLTYDNYRVSQYDAEAVANLLDLHFRTTQLMSNWGLGEDNDDNHYTMYEECLDLNPSNGGVYGSTATMDSNGEDWEKYDLKLDGPHHWQYRICLGYDVNDGEGFIIGARRELRDETYRYIFYGSGMTSPAIDVYELPPKGQLRNVKTRDQLFPASL